MGCAADGTNTIRCIASSLRLLLLFLLLGDPAEHLASSRAVPGAEVEDVPSFVIAFAKSLHQEEDDMEEEIEHRMESIPESLRSTLYPFQVESVKFAIKRRGRILLGDEMGLGKTLQALAIACAYREDWPLLVVAPSSLRQNWRNEAVKWVPGLTKENTQVVNNAKDGVRDSALAVIVSYELASRMVDSSLLWQGQFQIVVADESHYLKSVDAKRSQAVVPLLQKAARAMCVTGTPALSRPAELFMQLDALMPKAFPGFHPFALRYCAAHQGRFGLDVSGSSNTAELKMLLEEAVMVRRLKEEVLSDMLPRKDRQMVDVPCDEKVMKEISELLEQKEGIERAMGEEEDESELLRLRGMQQGVTSQLYCSSGKAKVKGVLAHLRKLLTSDVEGEDHPQGGGQGTTSTEFLPPADVPSSSRRRRSTAGMASQGSNEGKRYSQGFVKRESPGHAPLGRDLAPGEGGGNRGRVTESGSSRCEWTCSMCTYLNAPSRRRCEMCGTDRPGDSFGGASEGREGHGGTGSESRVEGSRRQSPPMPSADERKEHRGELRKEASCDHLGRRGARAERRRRRVIEDDDSDKDDSGDDDDDDDSDYDGGEAEFCTRDRGRRQEGGRGDRDRDGLGESERRKARKRKRITTSEEGAGEWDALASSFHGHGVDRGRWETEGEFHVDRMAGPETDSSAEEEFSLALSGQSATETRQRGTVRVLETRVSKAVKNSARMSGVAEEVLSEASDCQPRQHGSSADVDDGEGHGFLRPRTRRRKVVMSSQESGDVNPIESDSSVNDDGNDRGVLVSVAKEKRKGCKGPWPRLEGSRGKGARSETRVPRKLVVFAHHKEVLDALESGLRGMGVSSKRIDGATNQTKRQPIVDSFQNDPSLSVILLAITAAGVGITLTAASSAVFAELYWTPGVMAQAEDRIHRIGQEAKVVLIQYLIGKGTMDDSIIASIHRKQTTLKSTVGLNRDAGGYSNVPGRQDRLRSAGNFPGSHLGELGTSSLPAGPLELKFEFTPPTTSQQEQQQEQQREPSASSPASSSRITSYFAPASFGAAREGSVVSTSSQGASTASRGGERETWKACALEGGGGGRRGGEGEQMQELGFVDLSQSPSQDHAEESLDKLSSNPMPMLTPPNMVLPQVAPARSTSSSEPNGLSSGSHDKLGGGKSATRSACVGAGNTYRDPSPRPAERFGDAQRAFVDDAGRSDPELDVDVGSIGGGDRDKVPSAAAAFAAGLNGGGSSASPSASVVLSTVQASREGGVQCHVFPGQRRLVGGTATVAAPASPTLSGGVGSGKMRDLPLEVQERIARNKQLALQKLAEKKRQRQLQHRDRQQQDRSPGSQEKRVSAGIRLPSSPELSRSQLSLPSCDSSSAHVSKARRSGESVASGRLWSCSPGSRSTSLGGGEGNPAGRGSDYDDFESNPGTGGVGVTAVASAGTFGPASGENESGFGDRGRKKPRSAD